MDRRRAKKLLTEQLAGLDEREGWARGDGEQQVPDPGAVSQHPADFGTDLTNEMERDLMTRTIERERQQILEALQRIEDGTYGHCQVDGEKIADARLEARPEAEYCLPHQEEMERHRIR
jgi:RNA polymerase-binding transcription factor DksA